MLRQLPSRHLGPHRAATGVRRHDRATRSTMPDTTASAEPSDSRRRSPLEDRHRGLGANMTAFGGWDMPLDYGSVVAEHTAVRTNVGVFDLSHLGTLRVTGPDATDVI